MPGYKGHMAGALIAVGLCIAGLSFVGYALAPVLFAQGVFFAWLGALFPDIDTKSKGQKLLYAILFVTLIGLFVYGKYLMGAAITLCAFLPLFVNHRGLLHSFTFIMGITFICVAACTLQFPLYASAAMRNGLFFLVGVFSHLILDFGPRRIFKR